MGSVTGTSTVDYLEYVTLTAIPAEGYHIVKWTNAAGDSLGNALTIMVQALRDSTITANFAINTYDIVLNYDAARGIVTNDDASNAIVADGYIFEGVEHGTVLHLTAATEEGSRFTGWYTGSSIITSAATISYSVVDNAALTANFIDAGNFQVTLNYNNVMGTVTGAGEHHADNNVTITATPNYGYRFVEWRHGETVVSTDNVYSFVMPMYDAAFTAIFDSALFTVTAVTPDAAEGTVTGTQTVKYMKYVTLSAEATPCYHFVKWTNAAGDSLGNLPTITVQALRDSAITANFATNIYTGDTNATECDAFTWHGIAYNATPATAPTYIYNTVDIWASFCINFG